MQTGKALGIIDPAMAEGGTFGPKESITREEMTSFIVCAYEYKTKKNTDGKWIDNKSANFKECLQDEKWDIIVIHTANSGSVNTYEPHLTNLLKYI